MPALIDNDGTPEDFIRGMRAGDFSRWDPAFQGDPPLVRLWHERGVLESAPDVLAEALTCACFLGHVNAAAYLLEQGVDPNGGAGTGLDALQWAANRGQLATLRLLLRRGARLEAHSMYGGTALGGAVWAAIHEPRPTHGAVIEELLRAGARVDEAEYPSGSEVIDAMLRRYGASTM